MYLATNQSYALREGEFKLDRYNMLRGRLVEIYITKASTVTGEGLVECESKRTRAVRSRFDRPYVRSHGFKLLRPRLAPCSREHVFCRHQFHIPETGAIDGI
jgi:hypothetical protein